MNFKRSTHTTSPLQSVLEHTREKYALPEHWSLNQVMMYKRAKQEQIERNEIKEVDLFIANELNAAQLEVING